MKKIAIHHSDKTKYPNLALMKLSSHYKNMGDSVSWYDPIFSEEQDIIYSSKVFTFTPTEKLHGSNVVYGGSGYDIKKTLPDNIEHICPDYSLYDIGYSLGFLTRGCINKCSFCIVPEKEGEIRKHADIEEFLRHDKVVFMDNNVLASDHGIDQIGRLSELKVKVDFNQGLDSRLIDPFVAKRLSKLKWLSPVRLACDSHKQISDIKKAVTLLRWENVTPRRYFVYCLIKDVGEAVERIKILKGLDLDVFAQPYIDIQGNQPTKAQKDLARWVNHKAIFKSVCWDEYKTNKLKE